jgi:hypothetical protein
MTTTKATKLTATLQKSYYGKAKTRQEGNAVILTSYATDVARIEGGKLFRLWSGWSSTTAKHINDFCKQYGLPTLNKSEWMAMPCENPERVYQITQSNGFCTFTGQALLTATECEKEAEKIRRARGNRICVCYD